MTQALTPQKRLGERIRLARVSSKMSQADLGKLISLSQDSISRFERGETIPDAIVMQVIARALGQSMDYFQV